jgi:hypothetical protein
LSQAFDEFVWRVSMVIVDTQREIRHFVSSNKGECWILVVFSNTHEFELKGGGEEKIRATCLWWEAYALLHGNIGKFHYIFFVDCILVLVTNMPLSNRCGNSLLHVSTQFFVEFVI